MSLPRISKKARLSAAIAMSLFSASVSTVYALPTDGTVKSGEAVITTTGDTMNITQTTDRAAIDWTSFDIAKGETVNFDQKMGPNSIALNRVTGNDVSEIYGTLNANGKVFLLNQSGILFAEGASVDVGGLYASTANVNDTFMKEFGNNTDKFSLEIGKDNTAAIINQAKITAINDKLKNEGGLVVLHAANVDNEGKITTGKGGKVQLAAGKTLNINYDSAKINFTVDGGLSEANVLNAGTISAQNGVIAMTARGADKVLSSVVNTEGARLEAKGLAVNEKGEIVLDAGTGITAISGTVDVSGENGADGGTISAKGGSLYIDGTLNANGANGGTIETTADNMVVTNKAFISAAATAENGTNGTWNVNTTKNVDIKDVNKNIDLLKKNLVEAEKKVDELFKTAQEKYAEAEKAKQARDEAQAKVDALTKEIAEKTPANDQNKKAMDAAKKDLDAANTALADAKKKYNDLAKKATAAEDAAKEANKAYEDISNAAGEVEEAYEQLVNGGAWGVISRYANFEKKYNALKKLAKEELQKEYLKHFYTEEGFAKHFGNVLNFIDLILPENVSLGWPEDQYKASQDVRTNFEENKTTANAPIVAANEAKKTYDKAIETQSDKQGIYDKAEEAYNETNNPLEKLKTDKANNEKAVTDNETARSKASADNRTNLNSGMDELVSANKTYAQSLKDTVGTNGVAISNTVLSNTLTGTNVNITTNNVHQLSTDIVVSKEITKSGDTETNLTLTADRNVVFNAGVTSDKELNLTTKAGSKIEKTAGVREGELYGANIVKADITTNGDVTLENNSYIGFNGEDKARTISAKNVKFGGNVVLATGDTVTVKAAENVTFGGSINSGNAYSYEELTNADIKDVTDYWEKARAKAKGNTEGGSEVGDSYLATITDGIEDSAVTAVLPTKKTAYVGGAADAWETDADGKRSRVWKWADGPEKEQYFFTQTAQKGKNDTETAYSFKVVNGEATNGYANFCSGEPNDDSYKQPVLSVGYTDTGRGETDYNTSRWDDLFNKDSGKVKGYITETNLANSSINIEAGKDISLSAVGNTKALGNIGLTAETAHVSSPITTKGDMTINAALTGKNISLTSTEGSITLNNTVTAGTPKVEAAAAPQLRLMRLRSAVPTEGDIELNAAKDISSNGVTAQNKISFNAGNNVNLKGELKAGSNENGAVQISAGEAFINNVGANVIDTNGTWQIFSSTPENDVFNDLNSNNTAIWNADGTVNNGGENTYSFKYQPILTVAVNNATKTYGDVSTGDGCKVTSNLVGKNKNGEDLSKVFKDTTLAPDAFVEGVKLTSDGFASLASVADYDIKAEASGKNGYGLEIKDGKLTVNPKNVILSYGGFEIVNNRINVLEGTPSYDSQVVEGDTTAPKVAYGTTGLGDGLSYGIDYYVDGKKISSGDTVGNYRFNYDTAAVITLDNPEDYKPQTNELMTSAVALKGNADVVLSQKTAKVDGVDKVAGLMDGRLPLFKFAGSQVIPCGMFDISSTPDSVTMTASKISETDMSAAMEMPELEVNQYREYDRMLDTVDGAAAFKLTYNGASFDIYPNDNQATALLEKGEETNNVNVGAAALSAAFGEMGLSLEEMQVICVHMDAKEILA